MKDLLAEIPSKNTESDGKPKYDSVPEFRQNENQEKKYDPKRIVITSDYKSPLSLKDACEKVEDGGTIILKPGDYSINNTISINRTFTITAESKNMDNTKISGHGPLFSIVGGSCKFEWLTFKNESSYSPTIRVNSGTPEFTNCAMQSGATGIYLLGENTDPLFTNCKISFCKIGLDVSDSAQGTFKNCKFTYNHKAAVSSTNKGKPTLESCKIFDNGGGVYIGENGQGIFRKNTFGENEKGDWDIKPTAGKVMKFQNSPGNGK